MIRGTPSDMAAFIIILLLLAVLGVLGAVVEGLLWLTFAAVVLFVAGAVFGWIKVKASQNT